jgi:hypothetical protein
VPARQRSPRWIDEEAVAEFVAKEIAQDELDELYRLEEYKEPDIKLPKGWRDAPMRPELGFAYDIGISEWEAVEAAMCGDVEPLAMLLRPFSGELLGLPDEVNPAIKRLSPDAWEIIVQFLTGERNPKTGKLRGERGPRKKSAEERRAESPVHGAAAEVDTIRAILRRSYPDQHNSQIRDRAIEIAAQRNGVEASTLAKYLRRPRKDRRRLTT